MVPSENIIIFFLRVRVLYFKSYIIIQNTEKKYILYHIYLVAQ
jgi:hypothetical protein